MEKESNLKSVSVVSHIVEQGYYVLIEKRSDIEVLEAVMNFDYDSIEYYVEFIDALDSLNFLPKKMIGTKYEE